MHSETLRQWARTGGRPSVTFGSRGGFRFAYVDLVRSLVDQRAWTETVASAECDYRRP